MKFAYSSLVLAIAPIAAGHAIPAAAATEAKADASALVAELVGDDAMVELAQRAFNSGAEAEVTNADAARVFAANPGLKAYVIAQVRDEVTNILLRELPALRRQIGTIVTAELTGPEIKDTLTFFRTSVGQKIKARAYASIGDNAGQTPEQIQQAATAAVIANLAPEDYPALMAFGASSAAQKMRTLNPRISAASQVWTNKLVADNRPRLQALAAKATSDFLSRKKKS